MSRNKSLVVMILLGILVLGPISLAFYQALGTLPNSVRMICIGLVSAIFLISAWLMRQPFRQMSRIKYWLLGGVLVFGLGLFVSLDANFPSSNFAQIHYSDGTKAESVVPTVKSAWGRDVDGYDMHPAYSGAVVPNSLLATFSSQPKEISLLFAKPQFALFKADGSPTESDGISVELSAFDGLGELGYSETFTISQKSFIQDKWIEKAIQMDAGISSVKVTLGWAAGDQPYYGSTIVGFKIYSWFAYVGFIGKILLVSMGFFVLALCLILNFSFFKSGSPIRRKVVGLPFLACSALVFISILLVAYWSESKTSFVFFWDYRNYWQKTESLYELMSAGFWKEAINIFSLNYSADYSMFPSVGPALLSLVTGYPTRVEYALSITALYAVPAYIMVAYLAKRLVDGETVGDNSPVRSGWVLASFSIFFGLPIYFGTTLFLMPDIGGVILFVGALFCASSLMGIISDKNDQTQPWRVSTPLFRLSISLGVFFSLMFIFRRWYVFAAAGIACSLVIFVLMELLRSRVSRVLVVYKALTSAVLIAFAALPLLCWVMFDWSRDIGQHDYANLYSSYKFPLDQDILRLRNFFGVASIVLCAIGCVILYRKSRGRRLFFALTVSTLIASLLFMSVQSPARHHLSLLMPLLGACLAGLSLLIARRFGYVAAICLVLLLIGGNYLAMLPLSGASRPTSYNDWLPQQQPYKAGLVELARWLALPENENKKFCLIASSITINLSIFTELWQIDPSTAKHAYDQRLVQLGQVDSMNGPPSPIVKQCQIFLVGVPFQTHLRPNQQFTLEIIQQDVLNGTGIGTAVERTPKIFAMGKNVEIRAYQSLRAITDEEYADLVKRFLDSKGGGNTN